MKDYFNESSLFIERLKKGEEDAYKHLIDRYHHRLFLYANSLANDRCQAEDIVQNVFIRTWEKRHSLRANLTLKGFLYKSVRNEFIDQYRKKRAITALEKKYFEELDKFVEKDEDFFEKLLSLVYREIQNLPPKCRKIFLMSKQQGFSNLEIAEHLDVSIKTIEYHITKAFSLLRQKTNTEIQSIPILTYTLPRTTRLNQAY